MSKREELTTKAMLGMAMEEDGKAAAVQARREVNRRLRAAEEARRYEKPRARCGVCGFRIRGKDHAEGKHHKCSNGSGAFKTGIR